MLKNEKSWYEINAIEQLDSPALVVYIDRVKENIKKLIAAIDHPNRLRPHVKTHKNIEVTELLLAAGITKFKCATIAEAEMLGMCKCKDVLLAYQPCGPKLERFIKLMQKYPETQYSCLVDSLTVAEQISERAKQQNLVISVFIDVNVGMNRSGISPFFGLELGEKIGQLTPIKLLGLHAYDGHIDEIDLVKRKITCMEIYHKMLALKNELLKKGFENMVLVMGGSPSFPIYSQLDALECSPGTFIYWDQNYSVGLPEQPFSPAALVIGRIVSLPSAHTITVDIGHKAVAAEANLQNRIKFLNAPDLKVIGHSEEHLVLQVPENNVFKIGDVMYGLPNHICPTCALYDDAKVIENQNIIGKWKTVSRSRVISV